MKKIFGILAVILCSTITFAQENSRKIVHGQAVNDSVAVQDVVVFNISAKVGSVLKKNGYFDIKARENDTLVFSGLLFRSKRIVLSADDVKAAEIKVKLQTFTNQLTEVIVESNRNLKPITGSKQDIIDKKYVDDGQTSTKNTVMPVNVTENGMDFVRMYKDVMKLLRKNNPNKNDLISTTTFTELVMKKIKYSFFNSTLKLQDDEIKLFLLYCENDSKVTKVMKSKSEFELMDFLIEENIDFKKLTALEKK
jgi:hypothetical protein